MKIVILGSCQASAIHPAVSQMLPNVEIDSFHVDAAPPTPRPDILRNLKTTDFVISQITADEQDPLHFKRVQEAAPRSVFLPIFFFEGLQPDYIHLDIGPERESQHFTGYVHSALIAAAYCLGLSSSQTKRLYSRYGANRLGFEDFYQGARNATIDGFAQHGYDIAPAFAQWEARGPIVHTPNHPRADVLATLSRMALNRLGFDDIKDDPIDVPDYLGTQFVWPSLIRNNRSGACANDLHIQLMPRHAGEERKISVAEYIDGSFSLYADKNEILEAHPRIQAAIGALKDVVSRPV